MKIPRILAASALLPLILQTGLAQTVNFKEYKLKNGLRVILSEDHTAPTFSIAVTYNVGSRDERAGRTGFAHLFEHMMFQGSANVGKGEQFLLVANNGGEMNGTTSQDRTNFFEVFPSNQIDLGLFLESDRMRSLAINQANLDNQRATVQEEKRQSYDNEAYGKTYEAILDTIYDNPRYKHTTIGSMSDLDAATVKDVAEFFKIYYAPNNAVLSMVGDFKSEELLAKIRKYFEDIPKQAAPPVPDLTEPPQTAERRRTVQDPLADLTQLDIAFKVPQGNTTDWYAMSMIGLILSEGQSSRMYQDMVKDKEVLQGIGAYAEERRGPSFFQVSAMLRPGKDPAEVEQLIYAHLERLKTEPVTDTELEKAIRAVRRSQVEQYLGHECGRSGCASTTARAKNLGESAVFYNDPNMINIWPAKYAAVTKAQIQQAARKYFVQNNRSVITTVPKPSGKD